MVGISNAYPIAPLADFYAHLKSQAKTILADCDLANPYSQTLYTAGVEQYKLLILYELHRPSVGNYENPADALQQEAKSVSIAAKNVDAANVAAR